MAKKKKNKKKRPPCPDPERYTWVNTRDGGYWRLKRGTEKEAKLNSVLQMNADNTRITNLAAKRVTNKLQSFLEHLIIGRTTARIAGAIKKSLLEHNRMDYSFLEGLDFQARDYDFGKLVTALLFVKEEKGVLFVSMSLGKGQIKKHSKLATGYFAELILLFGDPGDERSLRIDSTATDVYSFDDERPSINCVLSIQLPEKQPWMVMVKVGCTGKYVENAAKYKAMKVVRVGWGS
jgi:hypothetical protein